MAAMVDHGLRAQLRIGNVLTGQLYVAMAVFPDAKPATFKMEDAPFIPTVPNNLDQLTQQISSILTKLDRVPFDGLGSELSNVMRGAASLVTRLDRQLAPEAVAVLRQAGRSLASVGGLLNPEAGLPVNTGMALQELARTARSLRELSDYLQAHPDALLRGRAPDPVRGQMPTR
jgi:paraquat-inducible protein B